MSSVTGTFRRFAIGGLVATVVAVVGAFALNAQPAYAHGSTIDPMSRNYSCWKRWGSDFQNPNMATLDPMCWQAWQDNPNAMWNWNGLYRDGVGEQHQLYVPDGQLCSAGQTENGRYRSLDNPGPWTATNLSNNFTVRLHDQALHGAQYIRVYVTRQGYDPVTQPLRWSDLELVAQTGAIPPGVGTRESDPVLNGVTISINASAPGRTGRHVVYTIWKAGHMDQTYYLCADVNFGGSSQPPTTTTTTTSQPPTTTTTTTSQPPTTTTTGAPGACSASYAIVNSWPGGFQAEVSVTAGGAPISSWVVNWSFANGQTVTNYWSTDLTQSGAKVTARNVSYNGNLAAGATTTFGFLGTWNGTNSVPSLTCSAS